MDVLRAPDDEYLIYGEQNNPLVRSPRPVLADRAVTLSVSDYVCTSVKREGALGCAAASKYNRPRFKDARSKENPRFKDDFFSEPGETTEYKYWGIMCFY